MLSEGTKLARGISLVFAESSQAKTPLAAVVFRVEEEGPEKNATIEYEGYLTENTKARTYESLEACGWDGDRDETISMNQVRIVVEHEDQVDKDKKPTGRKVARVRWVNSLDRGGGRFVPVDAGRAASLKAEAKAELLKIRAAQAKAAPAGGASFPHGANAPTGAPPVQQGGPKF